MAECRICKLPEERDGLCPGHREEWILWAARHPWAQNEERYDWWIDARAAMVRDAGGGPCPYCDFVAHDTPDELAHMTTCHPEIVAERLSRIGEHVSPESIRATAGPRVPPLERAMVADTGFAMPGEDDRGPIESHPPIIVYTRDINRLREFGMRNNCGDSAVALHKLLDQAEERDG